MLEITSRVGGSKATLYNHFPSKEELFVECMFDMAENYLESAYCGLENSENDVTASLLEFGGKILRLICSPDLLAARRLMIAEAARSGIGKIFYEKICSHQKQLADFLSNAMRNNALRQDDALLAARQLSRLLEAEIFEPLLLCVSDGPPDETSITEASQRAVKLFMRAYRPDLAVPSDTTSANDMDKK